MGRAEDLFQRLENGGVVAIQGLFEDRANEDLHLEFKTSGDHGRGTTLHKDDRENLTKAVSGFANTDGGVIVWGIGTSREADFASPGSALEDCGRFANLLDAAVSGVTVPPVAGVRSIPIILSGLTGYVATLIPASTHGPHQHAQEKPSHVRLGSQFDPAHSMLLAGMFGRRPQPVLSPLFVSDSSSLSVGSDGEGAQLHLKVLVHNESAVVAKDAYLAWRAFDLPSAHSQFRVRFDSPMESEDWRLHSPLPRLGTCLASEQNRLAPFSQQLALRFHFTLAPPFVQGLHVQVIVGATGSAPQYRNLVCSQVRLKELYSALARPESVGSMNIPRAVAREMLGIE